MRKPERIDPIIEKLREAWKLEPDWRLGQLFSNLLGAGAHDVFLPEDGVWDKALDEFLEKKQPK